MSMIKNISTVEDVKSFFIQLISEGVNFHPDEDFFNYIHIETEMPTYTAQEAELRNKLMSRSFEICDKAGVCIYDLSSEIALKETGMDKFIPLPSAEYKE